MGVPRCILQVKMLTMILFKRSEDLRQWLKIRQSKGITTGFVPTMGALHEGHIRLVEACRAETGLCVCSIFVNPAQFNDPKDFEKYPVSLEKDIEMLHQSGADVLFLPAVSDIYPEGDQHLETYDLGGLESLLEGRYRPGHFQGVCQVMRRLLLLVNPGHLFMGQKDYQQCLVVGRLIGLLKISVELHVVATVREPDGLAQSSRNRRLTPDQRKNAVVISQALAEIRENLSMEKTKEVLERVKEKLQAAHFKTDYVCIARAEDLQPIERWNGREKAVALIAAYQGEVRLIDNMLLN